MSVKREVVEKAVDAILKILQQKDGGFNITDTPEKFDVQFTIKLIPGKQRNSFNLILPHTIHTEAREVCLFVTDLDQKDREYEKTVWHYENFFKKIGVDCISKIVPLKALRTDYSMYSSKRSLAKAYDLYLADQRVIGLLPGLLGKIFYAKKKLIPVPVKLVGKSVKQEIDKVVNNTRCIIQGTGSSSSVTAANSSQSPSEIIDNIMAACKGLADNVPGGWENIRNIHIKGADTPAIPIHLDFSGSKDVKLQMPVKQEVPTFIDEVTTVTGAKVMIKGDGEVTLIKDKNRGNKSQNKGTKGPKGRKSGKGGSKTEKKPQDKTNDQTVVEKNTEEVKSENSDIENEVSPKRKRPADTEDLVEPKKVKTDKKTPLKGKSPKSKRTPKK